MTRNRIALTLLLGLGVGLATLTDMVGGPYATTANSKAFAQTTPTLAINDVSITEGNSGTSNLVFTVTLTASGTRPTIGVRYATADGSPPAGATASTDYTAVSDRLIFPSGTGTTTMTISVPIIGDTAVEPDETFLVNLGPADGATISDGQGIGTITNDDAPPLPTLSISDASLIEGNAGTNFMTFTVSLTATGSWSNIVVHYETTDRMPPSAIEGSDYARTRGFLDFSQGTGNAAMTFMVPITGDATVEPDETFLVSLDLESGATVTRRQGVGTIVNDDGVPPPLTLSINDVSVVEGNSGTTNAIFTVTISAPSASAVTVDYFTADVGARVADNDYTSTSGTLTFPAGDGSPRTIAVPIRGDIRNEPDEKFLLNLASPVNATIADGIGECTIINDDSSILPELSISDGAVVEGNPSPTAPNAGTILLSLDLSNRSSSDITVDYTVVDGTATLADNDYVNTSGTLTIPAGHFHENFTILTVADIRVEPDEFFFVNFSNPVGATPRNGQAKCTIITDDCAYSINPTNLDISATGTTSNLFFSVRSEPDSSYCEWTAVSNDPWIHVDEVDNPHRGTGGVPYQVDRNSGPARTGTITVAGQTLTVNQRGTCPASAYAISPMNGTAASDGGVGSIVITAPGNCAWTASPTVSWIHLSDTTTTNRDGQGSGEITYSVEPNGDTFRSGSITINGVIQHTVNQDAKGCPLELICALFPGLCAGNPGSALTHARGFRDKVLATTPRGVAYTHLYYQFSPEAVQIMMFNPMLILRSREVMERYMPVIQSMVRGEQVTLSKSDLDEIDIFLQYFSQKGSPEFRETLKALSDDFRNPEVYREFNITITDGPSHELPAKSNVMSLSQTGMMIAPLGVLLFCIHTIRRQHMKDEVAQNQLISGGKTMDKVIARLASHLNCRLTPGKRLCLLGVSLTIFIFLSPPTTSAHITSLIPSSTVAGGPAFTLRILGTDFDESDTVRVLFNGTRVSATLISAQELRATIPANLIVAPGVVSVTLEGFNSVEFTINATSSCSYLISVGGQGANQLISQIFPSDGGTGTINISATSGCSWGARLTQGEPFVSLTSTSSESGAGTRSPGEATGSGRGTLGYSVTRNPGSGRRTAIIRLYRLDFSAQLDVEPFTVIQEGSRCPASAYAISPLNRVRDYNAGSDSLQISAPRDCAWTATSEERWIDVRTYTGFGDATVHYDVRSHEGPPRSGVINVGGKEFFVFQIPSDCFIRTLCAYFPSACRELGEGTLASSRSFRDNVLARTQRGQRYTTLYYRFSKEAVSILMFNPTLILRSQEVLQRYKPVLDSMIRGEQVSLTEGDIAEIESFLKCFDTKGSPELREAMKGLCEDLRDPQLLAEFNITVIDGPMREMSAGGSVGRIKTTGLMITPLGLLLSCFSGLRIRRKNALAPLKRLIPLTMVLVLVSGQGSGQWSVASGQGSGQWSVVSGQGSGQWSVVSGQGSGQLSVASGQSKDSGQRSLATDHRPLTTVPSLPLSFEANQGQTDSEVKFISRGQSCNLFLTQTETIMALKKRDGNREPMSDVLRMKLIDANPRARVEGLDKTLAVSNHFTGGDSATWRTNVPSYTRVRYSQIYPGVDVVYYGNGPDIEYDFIVAAGANPDQLRLAFEGVEKIDIDATGDLVLRTPAGDVQHRKPVAYQEVDGKRKEVGSRYSLIQDPKSKIHNPVVAFEIEPYNTSRPLIIDPVLSYSTYFGGSGNEEGNSIAVDSAGSVYITGFTDSINFPLANASQPTLGGGQQDAFVVKLDPSGTRVVYSTYLGGNGQDNATSIAVDSTGNACITGFTDSTNFPLRDAFQQTKRGDFSAFVVKLNPTGTLLNSTLFGGSTSDYGSSIAVDSAGNIYAAGIATSLDLPMTNAIQPAHGGLVDLFAAKIDSSGSRLIYSTYLGGIGIDGASSIAVDSAGNLYVTGLTSSPNFRTVNALQTAHGGGLFDAFVVKLNPSGTQVIYSTYLGGGGEDRAFRVAVDSAGSAYVAGDTDSTNFPVANAAQQARGGSADAFVAKLSPSGSQLVYSTFLGGSGIDGGTALALDSAGSAYVTGFTASTNFTTTNPVQQVFGGAYDAFIAKLSSSGSALEFSTYLGGSGNDSGFGIATDASGNAYVMGVTDSANFPVANAFQSANGGGTADLFIAKIRSGPTITGAMIDGKRLVVFGNGFDSKAKILIDGATQKSANDDQSPGGALIGKKAGKKIKRGDTVTLQVRNSDGTLSNEFRFTRQ